MNIKYAIRSSDVSVGKTCETVRTVSEAFWPVCKVSIVIWSNFLSHKFGSDFSSEKVASNF